MSELFALLERVKAATGPDRELDDDLLEAAGIGYYDYTRSYYEYEAADPNRMDLGKEWHAVSPTRSIDAALALTERMLPGWWVYLETGGKRDGTDSAELRDPGKSDLIKGSTFFATGKTAPLAILAALLSALIAQERQP